MATTSRRGNPGTPYTPGVDGGGTNPGHRGNPGTPYEPPYKKDEKPTTESRGTPYTPGVNGGGTTPSQPSQPSQPSTSSSSSHDEEQQQQNRNPFYNPGQQSTQQQQQDNNNNNFINGLSSSSDTYGVNANKLNRNTRLAELFNATPTQSISAQAKIAFINRTNAAAREQAKKIQANLKAQQAIKDGTDVPITAKDLKNFADTTYWTDGRKQNVSYATSIEYYNMERNGYELVYVEDGTGALQDKGGIYTIGRDKLAGLPSNVKTVLVDNQGNWKYLADTTSRADHIEALQNKLEAVNKMYEYDFSKEVTLRDTAYKRRNTLEGKIAAYERIANKTKAPEDIQRLQSAIDALAAYNNVINDSQSRLESYGKEWAAKYEFYDHAINKNSKWTVEDEAQYQELRSQLALNHGTPESITMFNAMTRRRAANADCSAFMNRDYIEQFKSREEAMQKAVDEFNKWDSVTIHMEKGEDLGVQLKRLAAINLGYDPNANDDTVTTGLKIVDAIRAIRSGGISALPNIFKKEYWDRSENTYKAIGTNVKKQFAPVKVAYDEYKKAASAYKNATQQIERIVSGKGSPHGSPNYSDILGNLYAKQNQYLQASDNAITQGKNIFINNIISNMSVFDITSVESTFTAWRMASHADRYSDDPKFKKMQEAYKAIYGTDYRGNMDAGKMAMAMLQVKLGRDDDYIYINSSDLRNKNGDNYGFWGSLAVSMLTDVSNLAGIGKGIVGLATRNLGARAVTDAATESIAEALVRANVSDDIAREFAESNVVQRAIRKDVRAAIKSSMKEGGDDLIASMKTAIMNRAELLDDFAIDDFKRLITRNQYDDFLRNADKLISQSDNITRTALQVQKGTMLTHALGSIDDALNDLQVKLFQATNPVAGSVVAVSRISKAIKDAHNLKLAQEDPLYRLLQTTKQAYAKIEDMGFDSVLDGVKFQEQVNMIKNEFYYSVVNGTRQTAEDIIEPLKDCSDYLMRETANSYTYHIINKLDEALNTLTVDAAGSSMQIRDALGELTKLAQEHGYNTFDEMYDVIKTNIQVIYDASPDARFIVEAFDRRYADAVLNRKIANIQNYVQSTEEHVADIKSLFDIKGRTSVITETNAKMHPGFVQGVAQMSSDYITDFLRTVNNDFTNIIPTNIVGKEAITTVHSIHETGAKLVEALDNIALGDLSSESIRRTQAWLYKYTYEMDNIYLNEIRKWGQDTIQDVFGVQDYLKGISAAVPNHSSNTQLLNTLTDSMQKFFAEKGMNVSKEELLDKVIRQNPNEFVKLPTQQQASLIYRVMENKGHMITSQINDANLKILTDQLVDCNAQLNKNLRLLAMNYPVEGRGVRFINDAISNACAMSNTRILSTYLKSSNIDNNLHMAVMDVFAGSSNKINSLLQSYTPDVASSKIRDFIIDEAKKQLSLHNGEYSLFTELGCNTMDVGANVTRLEELLNSTEYSKLFQTDENTIDICVSMIRSTDSAAPKDVAFHVLGSEEAPTVLRKNTHFTVYDDGFARRTYSSTAQKLTDEYAALGVTDTLSTDDWIKQTQDYINAVKQQALEENKTIRFIGFNTSDAVSGDNKYISDVLRSCGVSANTANSIDFADVIRASKNQYVFDPKDINALDRSLRLVVDEAHSKAIALGISKVMAYNPTYNCADMLSAALKNVDFGDDMLNTQAKYILDSANTVSSSLGTEAYNKVGLAMGTYIDSSAFAKLLDDAGLSSKHANGDIMKIVANATVSGESQLNIHKIIETAVDEEWIDYSKFTKSFTIEKITDMERIHEAVLQFNKINESIRRVDLITVADKPKLTRIYKDLLYSTGSYYHNSSMYTIARAVKVNEITAQQLYAVNKWMLDSLEKYMDYEQYTKLMGRILTYAPEQTTKLMDVGYNFLRNNIIDYTSDSIEEFAVKYLDDSELGYQFAQSLNDVATHNSAISNIKNYMDTVDGLFNNLDIHGVQDRMIAYQLAQVHKPIMDLQQELIDNFEFARATKYDKLMQEAVETYGKGKVYDKDIIYKIAYNDGVASAKQYLIKLGNTTRSDAVQAVMNLDGDAFRAHLIRNCLGGIIIDPTASMMRDVDLATLFEQWRSYGATIDAINFSKGAIKDRKLFRVYIADLGEKNADEIFTKYNHTDIHFENEFAERFNGGLRHSSFNASDMTLVNANHMDNFRDLFFRGYGSTDVSKNILDLNTNFSPWADELYSCNMWTDMDIKQLVNPYYTDNILNNLAQNTHQLRNNISAAHDLGTIVNNRYMNTRYILTASNVLSSVEDTASIAAKRGDIIKQITEQKQHLCRVVLDKNNKFQVIDYTPRLLKKNTSDEFFEAILDNTVMLDESMMDALTDWRKTTNIGLKLQASNAPEWLTYAYNLYKKTVRSATVTMYLYGNLGTAVRNFVDSSTKGANEVMQYNEDMLTYLKKYKDAVSDVHEYSNIYRQIELDFGTVNRETIAKFFDGDITAMNKFNVLYGYEHICGESLLQDETIKELHRASEQYLMDNLDLDVDIAKRIRKEFDKVYGSPKYYAMTRAQIEKHMKEIHDAAMDAVYKNLHKDVVSGQIDLDALSKAFYNYHPTVSSWGDKMAQFPVLGFNRARFNNAETRARLAVYQTFLEGGASEAEAMKHVTATQFHYAGIGKVEDFMPFTQYKLYNALYWFDHASARTTSTAWRAAQYNGDGAMTNEEISNLIAKYRQASYYIYDAGMDEAYDNYFQNVLEPSIEGIFESGSYLGVPREYGLGNLDLNGTHYLKLGNSFIEEADLVATCMASAAIFAATMKYNITQGANTADKIRWAYQSLKFTPLYDSFYSPWKSYADLVVYTYDHYPLIAKHNGKDISKDYRITSKDVWDCYKNYFGDKDTRSLALSGLPVVGAVLSNLAGRWKSFNLNAGLLAAMSIDPDSREELFNNMSDILLDVTGMFIPSVVGTRVEPEDKYRYDYYRDTLSKVLISNPGTYFDMAGRLQRDFGFTEDETKEIMDSLMYKSPHSELATYWMGDRSKRDYFSLVSELFGNGYTPEEITNLFKQNSLPEKDIKRFMVLSNALPGYLKYDKEKRAEIIAYYKAMGLSTDEAWARLINHPAVIENGRVREINIGEAAKLSKQRQEAYNAIHYKEFTKEDWDAYWKEMAFQYPKGKWSETYQYLKNAGYSAEDARKMLLHGYMLDESGMLVDVPGKVRARVYSYSTMNQAEWDAYWNTVPDYTKYEKGAFGRTMKALKGMGYTDEQARTFIQLGVYANKDGTLMNVTGMERPVLGFPSFNAYYQSLPDYIKYEKGAFKRTYAALKNLGFDYETSLMLIQQGAYLMDMSMAQGLLQTLGARRNKDGSDIAVTDINTLLARYGGQIILSADGTPSMLVNCSGLTRPRRTYSYSRRGRSGSSYGSANNNNNNIYKNIRRWKGRRRRSSYARSPKLSNYKLKKPFILNGNVSTFSGMTNFRGSNKLGKPYTTKGYVSTYSSQNFLNGSSYGMRKTYKIDMRQFKTGALSIKSDYPTSYRNIAVAYRRNMYKDLYAKYGMSRMRMRANKQGYSNAAITRLRRNEIQNRERYDERRDQITKTKTKRKASV